VIILAGNTRPLEDLIVEQTEYLLALDGMVSADDQAQIAAVQDTAARIKTAQPTDPDPGPLFNAPLSYWLALRAYDPVATAQQITPPMLIVQGERDYQVTMADFQGWLDGLAPRDDVTFITYPGLNHLFITGEGPATPAEYDMPGHISRIVISDIVNWIKEQTP
ncbi:MAG: alpha/beta hydrolase, partial [Anaerolineae bacterium]|nr:alpha/beta hydrolase [Anaerolineae bacterium]